MLVKAAFVGHRQNELHQVSAGEETEEEKERQLSRVVEMKDTCYDPTTHDDYCNSVDSIKDTTKMIVRYTTKTAVGVQRTQLMKHRRKLLILCRGRKNTTLHAVGGTIKAETGRTKLSTGAYNE